MRSIRRFAYACLHALAASIGLLMISAVLFIDWRQLLERKKLRLNFAIWKQ